jgi:hypothetical protein
MKIDGHVIELSAGPGEIAVQAPKLPMIVPTFNEQDNVLEIVPAASSPL